MRQGRRGKKWNAFGEIIVAFSNKMCKELKRIMSQDVEYSDDYGYPDGQRRDGAGRCAVAGPRLEVTLGGQRCLQAGTAARQVSLFKPAEATFQHPRPLPPLPCVLLSERSYDKSFKPEAVLRRATLLQFDYPYSKPVKSVLTTF